MFWFLVMASGWAQDIDVHQLDPQNVLSTSCDHCALSAIPASVGAPQSTSTQNFSRVRCDDLFGMRNGSPQPPAWVDPHDGPGARFVRRYWVPGCSFVHLDNFRRQFPHESPEQVFVRTQQTISSHDLCARGAAAMRGRPGYRAPSQRANRVESLFNGPSEVERQRRRRLREDFERQVQQLIARATEFCCGPHESGCRDSMNALEIHWCQPAQDPNAPDPCITVGTNFALLGMEYGYLDQFFRNHRNAAAGRGRLPPPYFARVQFAPYLNASGTVAANLSTAMHEIGHACSQLRRMLDVNQGSVSAYDDLSRSRVRYRGSQPAEGCQLTESSRRVYLRVFGALDESNGVGPCLLDVASHASRHLYGSGQCAGACPLGQAEEAAADWVTMMAMPDNLWMPHVLPNRCHLQRDNEHAAQEEEFGCFFRSSRLQERVRRLTRCR